MATQSPQLPPRLKEGVYASLERQTAVVFKLTSDGVWFLAMRNSSIVLEHLSDDRFLREYPKVVPNYPVLRAVRKYESCGLPADDKAKKVMHIILRDHQIQE